jgi:anti-anti-sigma factor
VASTATAFTDELRQAVQGGADKLVIDLKGVDTVDSVGIQVIASAHNSMKKTGGSIAVTHATRGICNLFKALKLDEHLNVCGTH